MKGYQAALALILSALAVVTISKYQLLYSTDNELVYDVELQNLESVEIVIEKLEVYIYDENETLVAHGELKDTPVKIEAAEYKDVIAQIFTDDSIKNLDERYEDEDLFSVEYYIIYKKGPLKFEENDTLELTKSEIVQLIEDVRIEIG